MPLNVGPNWAASAFTSTAVLAPRQKAERAEKIKWFAGGSAALGGAYALLLVVELVRRALTA